MQDARYCFLFPLAVAVGSLALLVALGAAGWPGVTGAAGLEFCEAAGPGPVKQPVNTYSNAGFYLVGLWIGAQAWSDVAARKKVNWANRLVTTVRFPASYAVCSVLIGFGSSALHASTTRWGAELDHLVMHLGGAWCVAYALTRLFRGGDRDFFRLLLAQATALAVRLVWGQPYSISGSNLFAVMVALTVAIEAVGLVRNRHRYRCETRYLSLAVAMFLTAYTCFLLGKSAHPACDPASLWQLHAAWHLLSSGSTMLVYLYARSERLIAAA